MSSLKMAARAVGALLLCASWLPAAEAVAAPNGTQSVIVVLDASASMQGKIGKQTKMEIARGVAHELVKDWDPRIPLGLTAYGHRSGRCDDIEAVVPVSPLDAPSFLATVDRLEPKGKTPITAAVKNAAEQLGYAKSKATVILISDGVESCGGNLCALASQLKKQGVDFTAHVVGFGVTASETKQLACLAENTGGQYRAAKDAPSLKQALGSVIENVKQQGEPPATQLVWATGIRPLPEEILPGKPIKLVAVRVPGGALLKPSWDVYNADKTNRLGHANWDPSPTFKLPPGKYRVSGALDSASFDYPFEVVAGTNHVIEVSLNSGKATFASFMVEGGPAIESRAYLLSEDGARQLDDEPGKVADFELAPGKYQVRVKVGNAIVTKKIEIKPGDDIKQDVYLDMGRVWLKAVAKAGGPALASTRLYVHAITPNGSVGEVVEDLPNGYEFQLAAGTYVLRFKNKQGQIEKKFTVKAGTEMREEVVALPP